MERFIIIDVLCNVIVHQVGHIPRDENLFNFVCHVVTRTSGNVQLLIFLPKLTFHTYFFFSSLLLQLSLYVTSRIYVTAPSETSVILLAGTKTDVKCCYCNTMAHLRSTVLATKHCIVTRFPAL